MPIETRPSRVGRARRAWLAILLCTIASACNSSGTLPGGVPPTTPPTQNQRGDTQPPSDPAEPPPPDPTEPPIALPPPPSKPDHFVLKNRQKFIGLPAYLPGVDQDAFTFSIVQPPLNGQLLGSPPNVCYVPDSDFTGDDWFTYQASYGDSEQFRTLGLSVTAAYVPPIGISEPPFGVNESHLMYANASYDYGGNVSPYHDAGNGPYTHYVDFDTGSDTGNPFGTQASPRRTIPTNLAAGSVVELHGTNIASSIRFTLRGQGTPSQPIFIRGPSAANKTVFRRPFSVEGNHIICENLEFDCQDFGSGTTGAIWFWVTNTNAAPYSTFHHVCLRHSLMRDQPLTDPTENPAGIVAGVRHFDPALNDPNLLVEYVVAYDVEIRNFAQWNDFTGSNDYSACLLTGNSRNVWVLDSHFHHLHGPGVGISRTGALSNQAPARGTYVGRNYIHHCKETAVSYKHGVDGVFSQNVCHTFRRSDSSQGYAVVIIDDDPTPDWPASDNIWVLFNTIYDAENGILHEPRNASSFPIDKHSRSYLVGNLLFDIRLMRGSPLLDGIAIYKGQLGESRIIGNTIYNSDHGIWLGFSTLTDTAHTTQVVRNNVVAELTERYLALTGYDGMHVFLTPDSIVPMTTLESNLHYEGAGRVHFNITQPGMISGHYYSVANLLWFTGFGAGSVQGDPQFSDAGRLDFRPATGSPAASGAIADDAYNTFKSQFGLSIDYYLDGTPRPVSGGALGALPPATP